MAQPIYYRFIFKPSDGSVELSHNEDQHPAEVEYHEALRGRAGEPETYHGYAYRIGGGWRLTDWEHKPINDPYVKAQVLRELRQQEGPHNPHPHLDDWTMREDPEFDQFHYGLPLGTSQDQSSV